MGSTCVGSTRGQHTWAAHVAASRQQVAASGSRWQVCNTTVVVVVVVVVVRMRVRMRVRVRVIGER